MWWSRADGPAGEARSRAVAAGAGAEGALLAGLACGARYRVWLVAHSAAGAGPPSRALEAATAGRRECRSPGAPSRLASDEALNFWFGAKSEERKLLIGPTDRFDVKE